MADDSFRFLTYLSPYYLLQYKNQELSKLLSDDKEITGLVYREYDMQLEKKFSLLLKDYYMLLMQLGSIISIPVNV